MITLEISSLDEIAAQYEKKALDARNKANDKKLSLKWRYIYHSEASAWDNAAVMLRRNIIKSIDY